jgi:O-antigen ligase
MAKDRGYHFGLFHALALSAGLAALASAAVSQYPTFALLKASSLLLLFFYAGTGARLAVSGRENRFFAGLITGCECFIGLLLVSYLAGYEVMGNPNSLGAVAGVVGAPVLLWAALLEQKPAVRYRRYLLYALCMFLVFFSHARAAMAAAVISCGLLCLALRKYKLLLQGVCILSVLIAVSAITRPEAFSRTVSSLTSSVLYKGRGAEMGLLASRQSPWQQALDSIHQNFWLGTGFGTTNNTEDVTDRLDQFTTNPGVTAENGSSYLAILSWVGMLGVVPFLLLLLTLLAAIFRTVAWMFQNTSPLHPAIPLAMVMIAGLLHAGFEDWLFAPGYYLCVFFWSMAFVLIDLAPPLTWRSFSFAFGRSWRVQQPTGGAVPSR